MSHDGSRIAKRLEALKAHAQEAHEHAEQAAAQAHDELHEAREGGDSSLATEPAEDDADA